MSSMGEFSAKDLALIIKTAGETSLTRLAFRDVEMEFMPKHVADAQAFSRLPAEVVSGTPETLTLTSLDEPTAVDLALEDPEEWQRQGMSLVGKEVRREA